MSSNRASLPPRRQGNAKLPRKKPPSRPPALLATASEDELPPARRACMWSVDLYMSSRTFTLTTRPPSTRPPITELATPSDVCDGGEAINIYGLFYISTYFRIDRFSLSLCTHFIDSASRQCPPCTAAYRPCARSALPIQLSKERLWQGTRLDVYRRQDGTRLTRRSRPQHLPRRSPTSRTLLPVRSNTPPSHTHTSRGTQNSPN